MSLGLSLLLFTYYSRLLAWIESPVVSPLITRLGEYTYHLGLLVPTTLYIKPSGIHAAETLQAGMVLT